MSLLDLFARRSGREPPAVVRPTLPADLVRKVRRIEISTKHLVDQGLAGDYHSAFKGRGVELAEVRPYAPGDEIRDINDGATDYDWRENIVEVPFIAIAHALAVFVVRCLFSFALFRPCLLTLVIPL